MSPVITRTVWLLSWVSLLADVASEMLYPILPVYLRSIGFSVALIGVLEGLAEATAGLSKGYFGRWSDRSGRRLPFVRGGYLASALAKPLMGWLTAPLWVFGARTLDRMGKGLRTGARDALLSAEAGTAHKGRVFGFHSSMDTVGAVLGPISALIYLQFYPGDYRSLFFIAFLPGLLSVAITFLLREPKQIPLQPTAPAAPGSWGQYWRQSRPEYRRVVGILLVFQLFNSSDSFLLLKMKNTGLDDASLIGAYILYNLVYALAAYPFGILADKIGMKRVFMLGLGLFVVTYAGFAYNMAPIGFYLLFVLYGAYAAATQGVAKAWLSGLCPKEQTATAIGVYTGLQSCTALLASVLTGLLWQYFGADTPFWASATGVSVVLVYLARRSDELRAI